jgi:hypothetical protein
MMGSPPGFRRDAPARISSAMSRALCGLIERRAYAIQPSGPTTSQNCGASWAGRVRPARSILRSDLWQ